MEVSLLNLKLAFKANSGCDSKKPEDQLQSVLKKIKKGEQCSPFYKNLTL